MCLVSLPKRFWMYTVQKDGKMRVLARDVESNGIIMRGQQHCGICGLATGSLQQTS
jgi:hypothetical protein